MRKLYTIHVASGGVQEDFERKGIPPLAVLEVLKIHFDKVQSGKQVFSIRLEDGTKPEPAPAPKPKHTERFATTRERINSNKADLEAACAVFDFYPGAKLSLVLSVVDDLAQNAKTAVATFAREGGPSELRAALIGLQACREVFDDMAAALNAADA